MRIRIAHSIVYDYSEPARTITQILRLTPRDHDGQHVMSWRVVPTVDGRLRNGQDAYGNLTHTLSIDGPVTTMTIEVSGEIETTDLAGVVRGGVERVPPDVFRRDTILTAPDEALRNFAHESVRGSGSALSTMHALMGAVHEGLECLPTQSRTGIGAAAALKARAGIAQDIAHVFMACARHLGHPARYVSGYVARSDELAHGNGAHAWAEVFLDDYGWIGFDPANGLCPIDTHVRIAAGLDFFEAAPVRGARKGGSDEQLSVLVSAIAAPLQQANQ